MNECTIQELALKLKYRKRDGSKAPGFALFLGAGASIESGIPGTAGMMQEFKRKLTERWELEGKKGRFEDWLKKLPTWKKGASNYSNLFEAYASTERQRVEHIQKLMAMGKPSFGYFCLSQLLSQGYIDTVITTNFDDLVYEACVSWTGVRPRVYAYGASSGPVRHEAYRPAIIKLHGDFLYSALKNTEAEVDQQDPNLRAAVRRLQDEYEIIVVGYGGNDTSIMSLFKATPRDAGLYWCTHKDGQPNERLREIMGRTNFFEVRTEGFDSVMDEFLHVVGFELPALESAIEMQQQAIVKIVSDSGSKYKGQYMGQAEQQVEHDSLMPLFLKGMQAHSHGDYPQAIIEFRRALEQQPDNPSALDSQGISLTLCYLGISLTFVGQLDAAIKALRRALELRPDDPTTLNLLGAALRDAGQLEEAISVCRRSLALRPANMNTLNTLGVALCLAGKSSDAQIVFEQVVNLSRGRDDLNAQMNRMIALIGVGRPAHAIATGRELIAKGPSAEYYLRVALGDLKPLAKLGIDGAEECVSMFEAALSKKRS
ncbi:MAG: tetratricopeptide repeat protein [Chloroflexi bacterium]|nr:tetratricopeptide repeat protein [Chloroflexota bacterium]